MATDRFIFSFLFFNFLAVGVRMKWSRMVHVFPFTQNPVTLSMKHCVELSNAKGQTSESREAPLAVLQLPFRAHKPPTRAYAISLHSRHTVTLRLACAVIVQVTASHSTGRS